MFTLIKDFTQNFTEGRRQLQLSRATPLSAETQDQIADFIKMHRIHTSIGCLFKTKSLKIYEKIMQNNEKAKIFL